MEHMLTSADATSIVEPVPCICEPPYYDGAAGGFLEYPSARNRDWLRPQTNVAAYIMTIGWHRIHHAPPVQDLQTFYQSWLFFGLLKETLVEDFVASDFVREEKTGRYITTAELPGKLYARFKRIPPTEADYIHYEKCIIASTAVLKTVLSETETYRTPPSQSTFDWRVMFCIASTAQLIGDTICHRLAQIKGVQRPMLVPEGVVDIPNRIIEESMRAANWCISEIEAIKTKFTSISTLFALSGLNKSALRRNHDSCLITRCNHYQINESIYQPNHICGSECDSKGNKELNRSVEQILLGEGDCIPVLNTALQVKKATHDTKYVAISHVWADGMGNPKANSLPDCTLNYLVRTVKELIAAADAQSRVEEPSERQEEIYFWIDTLCCPWKQSPVKQNAISRLRRTYEQAKYVLVLDAGLRSINITSLHAWEAFLHIFSSGWVSRLWTLQEGILSKDLWFQFKDRAESLAVLRRSLDAEAMQSPRVWNLRNSFVGQFRWLDSFMQGPLDAINDTACQQAFRCIRWALQHRSVSKAEDEPLCLCTALGLSVGELQLQEMTLGKSEEDLAERRMSAFWVMFDKKFKGIPIAVLVLRYPKLRSYFQWAPRTLLESDDHDWLQYAALKTVCRIRDGGLSFSTTGFIVTQQIWHDGLANNPWDALEPRLPDFTAATFRDVRSGKFLYFDNSYDRGEGASFRRGSQISRAAFSGATAYAVIPLSGYGTKLVGIALLGVFDEQENVVIHTFRVNFGEYDENRCLVLRTAEEIAHNARRQPFALILNQGDDATPAFQEASEQLKNYLLAEAADRLRSQSVRDALQRSLNTDQALHLGVIAKDWFYNNYVGRSVDSRYQWIIR